MQCLGNLILVSYSKFTANLMLLFYNHRCGTSCNCYVYFCMSAEETYGSVSAPVRASSVCSCAAGREAFTSLKELYFLTCLVNVC
jgi:hypothetical protein